MTKVLALAIVVLLALLGFKWGEAEHQHRLANQANSARDAAVAAYQTEAANRVTESKRVHRLQEAIDAEHLASLVAQEAARRADAAAVSLRSRARQLAADSRCPAANSSAAASGPPAQAPGDLLADMLERLDDRAGELARYADQARAAGQLCERAYDSLMLHDTD